MADQNESLPPHNVDAEMAVIGSMLVERDAIITASEMLRADDFYKEAHRQIFSTIQKLNNDNVEADVITVGEALKSEPGFITGNGASILLDLADKVPTALHVEHYARIVHEKALLRMIIERARNLIRDANTAKGPVNDLVDKAQEQFFAVGQRRARRDSATAGELMTGAVNALEEMGKSGQVVTGVATGFTDLDTMTRGFQPSNMVIVAARPSMGKTALVMNIAEHVAVENKLPVVFFSLEMSHQELALRLLCSRARLDMGSIRRGYLARQSWPQITSTAAEIADAPLIFDFATSPTIHEVRSAARRYAHEFERKGTPLKLVIIDYLQLMRGDGSQENRQQEISEISRSLKGLARELSVPVVALSQLNRKPEDGGRGGRPQLSDLRESGAIEQDADLVMAIYREEVYKRDDPDLKGKAKLFVLKQRNGPVGDVDLRFQHEYTRFVNAEHELESMPA